jgi:hypothetical protein
MDYYHFLHGQAATSKSLVLMSQNRHSTIKKVWLLSLMIFVGVSGWMVPQAYCQTETNSQHTRKLDALPALIRKDTMLTRILLDPRYQVQLIVSPVLSELAPKENKTKVAPSQFISYRYPNADKPAYFYPASLVKLPTMLATFVKLNQLELRKWDQYRITYAASAPCQTAVPAKVKGRPNYRPPLLVDYMKQICLVSDNNAYSRLYEFCGQSFLNQQLKRWGLPEARIIQRFAPCNYDQNKHTNAIKLYTVRNNKLRIAYAQPAAHNHAPLSNPAPGARAIGKGYFKYGRYYPTPMDFSRHNNLPLEDVHQLFCQLMIRKVPGVTVAQQDSLVKWLGLLPREGQMGYEKDLGTYHDSYKKYLVFGTQAQVINPYPLRIVNIVGQSHGWLSDVALIRGHVVSVLIYCDEDDIVGDGKYTTEHVGMPFLKRLGEEYLKVFSGTE